MSKIKLVCRTDEFTSFTSHYLRPLWSKYFDIEVYDPDKSYDTKSLFPVWNNSCNNPWVCQMHSQGCKIVVDNLWELPTAHSDQYHWLENNNWFWYNESHWWHNLGYNNYTPGKQISKTALMSMRKVRGFRDTVIDYFDYRLNNFIWSYGAKTLPNDADSNSPHYQRFFNPDWYDQTWMSIVVETDIFPTQSGFLTEKTFKPIAFQHPFVIVGAPGMLDTVRKLGFETYENLFDESYDFEESFTARLRAIINIVDCVTVGEYDSLTQQKMQHNKDRFFNKELVEQRIVKEIIEPLLHYAET